MSASKSEMEMEVEVAPSEMEVAPVTENSDASKSVMATSVTVGSVTVSLHPLVIMNVSEHWTRLRAQEGCPQQGIIVLFSSTTENILFNTYKSCP